MDAIKKVINQIIDIGSLENKTTVFLIGNTAKVEDAEFYLSPIRNYNQIVVAGAIVFGEEVAKKIARMIDGLVDYVFVDSEKKIVDKCSVSTTPGNIERAVREIVISSTLISYKANDLTVDAADSFIVEYFAHDIASIGGKKTAVIGAGNIGSKIAIKLVERGSDVSLYRRDIGKLNLAVDYINSTKSQYTVASAIASSSVLEACRGADILIGLTNGIPVIDEEIIANSKNNPLIVDIGKGSISKKAVQLARLRNIEVYRLSIESALEGMIISLISTHNIFKKQVGRAVFHGTKVVSGGLVACEDEFVVDNYSDPKVVYGLGNGAGDFERNMGQEMLSKFKNLESIINKKT
jgi:hypothetical protein